MGIGGPVIHEADPAQVASKALQAPAAILTFGVSRSTGASTAGELCEPPSWPAHFIIPSANDLP
jgi:hypothetical protein